MVTSQGFILQPLLSFYFLSMLTLDNLSQDNGFKYYQQTDDHEFISLFPPLLWVSDARIQLPIWMDVQDTPPTKHIRSGTLLFPPKMSTSPVYPTTKHPVPIVFDFCFFPSHILSISKSCWFYFQNITHLDHFPFLSPPSTSQPGSLNQPPIWSPHVYSCPSQSGFYTAVPMISLEQTSYHPFQWLPIVPAHGLFMSWACGPLCSHSWSFSPPLTDFSHTDLPVVNTPRLDSTSASWWTSLSVWMLSPHTHGLHPHFTLGSVQMTLLKRRSLFLPHYL